MGNPVPAEGNFLQFSAIAQKSIEYGNPGELFGKLTQWFCNLGLRDVTSGAKFFN